MVQFILDNFDTIFRDEKSFETFDKMILDLAVRGKLVPQIESEEPASELLQRIKEEKERLVSEKVIKKEKPLPPITEDEKPFNIPNSWEWVRLGDICQNIHYGYTAYAEFENTGVKLLRITDIQNNKVDWENVPYCKIDKSKLYVNKLNIKDILIARTGGTVGKTYLVGSDLENSVFASYLIRAILIKKSGAEYTKLYMGSSLYWNQLIDKTQGTGQPNVNATSLKGLITPLPPLEEQERIVQKVEKLQELSKKFKEIYNSNEKTRANLKKAILEEVEKSDTNNELLISLEKLFGNFEKVIKTKEDVKDIRNLVLSLAVRGKLVPQIESEEPASELLQKIKEEKERLISEKMIKKEKPLPVIIEDEKLYDIPDSWEWVRFNEVCSIITCGYASTPKYYETGKIFLSAKNVKPYKFLPNEHKFISEELYSKLIVNTKPEKNDILLTRVGAGIGEAAIIDIDLDFAIYVSLTLLKPLKKQVNSKYILHYINSSLFKAKVIDNTYGKNNSQGNLNVKVLREMLFPLPPLKEQERIVKRVDELMAVCDALESKIEMGEKINQKLLSSLLK